MPVFSIDYRMAPEHPYPIPLEDCFNVYYWLISQGFEQMGIRPKKVFVAGDSAGGNLVAAITTLCLQNYIAPPDLVILIYPTLLMSGDGVMPSIFYALDDPILNINFMKIAFDSYTQGEADKNDILLSPLKMSDELLSRYPPVRLIVATKDALRDEGYLFTQR